MANRNLITFDYGATSGRAILGKFDGKKIEIEEHHRFDNQPVLISGHIYWDVLRLFHELKQGLINLAQAGIKEVDSIGIDTWGVDFALLDKDDMLIITADHGCDPSDDSTDHTREYVPLLVYGEGIKPSNLGTKNGFGTVAKLVCDALSVNFTPDACEEISREILK